MAESTEGARRVFVVGAIAGAGGGGAATIADGADVAQGAVADAAVTNPALSASVIAALKGMLTLLGASTPAGEAHLGQVGGHSVTPSGAVTRPSDTNAYTAGDAITDSTSAPSAMTIAGAARVAAGSGTIIAARLTSSANVATKAQIEAWIFTAAPTPDNDNVPFTPTDAEMLTCVAVIPLNTWYVGDATAGAGGNAIALSDPVNRNFKLSSGTSLYCLLVVRNAYVPVSAEVFTLTLSILQD